MNKFGKMVIVIVLVAVVAVVIVFRQRNTNSGAVPEVPSANSVSAVPMGTAGAQEKNAGDVQPAPLPKLIDLGSSRCIPCRMMMPILEELKKEYAGRLEVKFIDVRKNPDIARQYRVKIIPTQIFLAPDGTELYRHKGFFPKKDIVAKWKELGIDLEKSDRGK